MTTRITVKASKQTPGWYVQIVESLNDGTEKIDRELGPYASEHLADKAMAGADRNLNHERFFTRQVKR